MHILVFQLDASQEGIVQLRYRLAELVKQRQYQFAVAEAQRADPRAYSRINDAGVLEISGDPRSAPLSPWALMRLHFRGDQIKRICRFSVNAEGTFIFASTSGGDERLIAIYKDGVCRPEDECEAKIGLRHAIVFISERTATTMSEKRLQGAYSICVSLWGDAYWRVDSSDSPSTARSI